MKSTILKVQNRNRKRGKIRAKISGTTDRPRLSVFKSNVAISAQLIDDVKGVTLAAASSRDISKGNESEKAKEVGLLIAKIAKEKNISTVVFDRGGYMYRGKVMAIAEGARQGGLVF